MKLVTLATDESGVSINPETVISVKQDCHGRYVLVKTIDNQVHEIRRNYDESIYDAHKRVTKLLNGEE